MNDWEKELGVQMFMNNFKALKQHCEEHEECKDCVFMGEYGVCILDREPVMYDLDQLEKAVRLDIERSEKNGQT